MVQTQKHSNVCTHNLVMTFIDISASQNVLNWPDNCIDKHTHSHTQEHPPVLVSSHWQC